MFRARRFGMVASISGVICVTGCIQDLTGSIEPGENFSAVSTMHVYMNDGDRETDVATAVQEQLSERGYRVTAGLKSEAPPGTDCLVEAHDKWFWDITMYLIEFKVNFRRANDGRLLASGRSYRTSLIRKDADFMVNEVLTLIFDDAPQLIE